MFSLRNNTKKEKGNNEEKAFRETDLIQIDFIKEQININIDQQVGRLQLDLLEKKLGIE